MSGSPPPMRGKVLLRCVQVGISRITPAYAGKSAGCHIQPKPDRDHPRLCGEKIKDEIRLTEAEGSPPPMRGKAESNCRQPARLRITPAYAGKSARGCRSLRSLRDHPRLCGEKFVGHQKADRRFRITPAYAGKS